MRCWSVSVAVVVASCGKEPTLNEALGSGSGSGPQHFVCRKSGYQGGPWRECAPLVPSLRKAATSTDASTATTPTASQSSGAIRGSSGPCAHQQNANAPNGMRTEGASTMARLDPVAGCDPTSTAHWAPPRRRQLGLGDHPGAATRCAAGFAVAGGGRSETSPPVLVRHVAGGDRRSVSPAWRSALARAAAGRTRPTV